MATTDELIMKINGEDYHKDLQFIIDENLRTIAIPKDGVVLGVCGDKDINRVNFRMNRHYNGFDLSTFSIRINYINSNDEPNYFVVTDIQADVDYITFTWLVDAYATKYVGEVSFCVRLFTESEGKIDSQFFSTIGKVSILEGIEVDSQIPEAEVYDIITRISSDVEDKIQTKADAAIASIPADYTTLSNDVSELKEDLVEFHDSYSEFVNADITIQNGYMDSSGNLTENASYRSAKVYPTTHRTYRAKGYMLGQLKWAVAYFCDSSGNVIGNTGIITETTQYDLVFTVPYNASYFVVNSRYESDDINKNLSLQVRVNKEYAELNDFNELKNDVEDIESTYYEFVDAGAEIKNGYISENGQFYPNDSYECSMLTIDKYRDYKVSCYIIKASSMPIAYFFDENMANIGNSGIVTNNTTFTMEEIIVPTNAKYMSITGNISTGVHLEIYVKKPTTLSLKKEITDLKKLPLYGKNAIFLGDSITAQTPTSWRNTFIEKTGVNQVLCTAVAGAHLCDYEDTVLNGTDFTGHGNTICNQVQRILNNPPSENIDLIMICAGTNDTGNTWEELNGNVTQFIDSNNQYIDVNTVDRTRFDGVMRWIAEKLWSVYPNASIFFATPIQAEQSIRASWRQIMISDYMRKVCAYLATPIIDATRESGIYGRYEVANANGKYLADGLHPNEDGKVKLGTYYASKVINYFSSK